MAKKKWGKIGAPKSAKRKAWLASLRRKKSSSGTKKKTKKKRSRSKKRATTTNIKGYVY